MPPQDFSARSFGISKPGRAVTGLMIAVGAIWLAFALAVNWAGASEDVFLLFCGNTSRILHGEVWRLFTAPWLHIPSGSIGHILWAVLGLLFFAPQLEQRWGGARFIRFFVLSSLIAYGFQLVCDLILPQSIAHKLIPEYWFGSVPALEAVAIAWALSYRGQTVRLWFLIPVTSTGLVIFIAAISVLRIIAGESSPEGLLSPIGGMLAGWLIGGGTPSPLRRAYLKLRLAQLDREAARGARTRAARRAAAPFRVLEGGKGHGTREGHEPEGHDDDGSNGKLLH
jgi:membrane associated rhomboid family serine protease